MTPAGQPTDEQKRGIRRELGLATALIATGLVISCLSLAELVAHRGRDVATPGTPTPESTKAGEPEPGGAGPTMPSPEPLRADAKAKTQQGASPLLPPEKTAPPIR